MITYLTLYLVYFTLLVRNQIFHTSSTSTLPTGQNNFIFYKDVRRGKGTIVLPEHPYAPPHSHLPEHLPVQKVKHNTLCLFLSPEEQGTSATFRVTHESSTFFPITPTKKAPINWAFRDCDSFLFAPLQVPRNPHWSTFS